MLPLFPFSNQRVARRRNEFCILNTFELTQNRTCFPKRLSDASALINRILLWFWTNIRCDRHRVCNGELPRKREGYHDFLNPKIMSHLKSPTA